MAFNHEALNQARAAAKEASDAIRARNLAASVATIQATKTKDDDEFKAAKVPKARKAKTRTTPPTPSPARYQSQPKSIKPGPSKDPARPAWMNDHVIDPKFIASIATTTLADDPAEIIVDVIRECMLLRVPDDLLNHKTNKAGDFPKECDTPLEELISHNLSARDRETEGAQAWASLRAIVPNAAKRKLITDYITKLLIATREACLTEDGLVEEINEHMPWFELNEGILDHHIYADDGVPSLDVPQMLQSFEQLSHDERCEFLAKAEKVRPLHPAFF